VATGDTGKSEDLWSERCGPVSMSEPGLPQVVPADNTHCQDFPDSRRNVVGNQVSVLQSVRAENDDLRRLWGLIVE